MTKDYYNIMILYIQIYIKAKLYKWTNSHSL